MKLSERFWKAVRDASDRDLRLLKLVADEKAKQHEHKQEQGE